MLIFKHHNSELATGGALQEKGVLRNFSKFTGKHLCQSLFFNKVTGRLYNNCIINIGLINAKMYAIYLFAFKDIIRPYKCLLKKDNFSVKTSIE